MRTKLLFIATILFLNTASVLGKAIPYTGFYVSLNNGMPMYGAWMPMGTLAMNPCGVFTRDVQFNEGFYALAKTSAIGTIIGSASNIQVSQEIITRRRLEKYQKATINASGENCQMPIGSEMSIPNATTYSNPSITYYGFKVIVGGLTYYGWMQTGMGGYFAYIEDIPGFSITVGDYAGVQTYPSGFVKLSGTVYRDNNIDGVFNAGDAPIANRKVVLENTIYTGSTGADGTYSLYVPGTLLSGSKNLKLQLNVGDIYNSPVNGSIATTFPKNSDLTGLNFGINFNTVSTGEELIEVSISNGRHRRCFKSQILINVNNNSNANISNVPLVLEIPGYVEILSSVPAYQLLQSKVATYTIPSIPAHGSYTISITDSIICGNESIRGQSQCYRASINIPFTGSDVFPYYECQNTVHMFKLVNKGNAEMADSATYKVFLNNILQGSYNYKTAAQDTFYIAIPNDGRSIRLEAFQELSNTRTNIRYSVAEGCGTGNVLAQNIGYADQLNPNEDNYSTTSCFVIRDSYDPNELIASPTGWGGADRKILKDQLITYHIGFQNTGSADAVSIVLVDTLSSSLDISSFQVQHSTHAIKSTQINALTDGRLRLVVTYAGINLPPSSANEPGSHGYVEFSILPKSTATIGAQIRNRAFIYFDFNSYIETNSVLQTLALAETLNESLSIRTSGAAYDVQDQTLMYGDSPTGVDLTTNAGEDGLAATSLNEDIVTFESGKLVIHKAGSATINYNHIGNNRYLAVEGTKSRTVTVEKAPLAINAVSYEREAGTANPLFDWIASGFVYNEDESVLQGNPILSCSADESSVMGDYSIHVSAGTLSSENYEFTFTPANLKVVQTTGVLNDVLSNVRIYPVPSNNGKLTVEVPYENIDRITLTNVLGETEVFYQGEIESKLQGILLMKVYTDNGVYNAKVELSH